MSPMTDHLTTAAPTTHGYYPRAWYSHDEVRAYNDGYDDAMEHIEAEAAALPAQEPLDVERIVRRALAIVDQTTPLSVGEPLVQRVLARLRDEEERP